MSYMGRDARWRQGRTAWLSAGDGVMGTMGGNISGSLWGLVLGVTGLGFISLVNEQPAGNEPPLMPQVTLPQAVQAEPAPTGLTPETPAVARDFAVTAPRVAVPEAEVNVLDTDTTPSAAPEIPEIATTLSVPESVSNPDITAGLEEPLISRNVTSTPVVPVPEQQVVIATQPAQPAPAAPVPDDTEVAGVAEDAAIVPDIVADAQEAATEAAPVAPLTQDIADVVVPQLDPAETSGDDAVSALTQAPIIQDQAPSVEPDIVVVAPEPAPEVPVIRPLLPEVQETNATPLPQVLEVAQAPQPPLPQVDGGVRVNRPGAVPSQPAGEDAEVVVADPIPDDAPALKRYAAVFEDTRELPLIAILMLDGGDMPDAVNQLVAFPFAVTVVIDALGPDANARMSAYRDAGIEVVMQTSLPMGAVPTDVEVAFEAAFDILPETVALFSNGEGILQNDRAVTEQVIQVLGAEGRGLVAIQRGLGNAVRGAEQAGLPAATVLRDLDGAGENAAAIARALDQAAFRARQTGDAVLLARVTPETIAALQSWGAQNDGDQIALAPVSAILRDTAGEE